MIENKQKIFQVTLAALHFALNDNTMGYDLSVFIVLKSLEKSWNLLVSFEWEPWMKIDFVSSNVQFHDLSKSKHEFQDFHNPFMYVLPRLRCGL